MVSISRGRGCCSPYLKVFLQGLVTSTSAPINSFNQGRQRVEFTWIQTSQTCTRKPKRYTYTLFMDTLMPVYCTRKLQETKAYNPILTASKNRSTLYIHHPKSNQRKLTQIKAYNHRRGIIQHYYYIKRSVEPSKFAGLQVRVSNFQTRQKIYVGFRVVPAPVLAGTNSDPNPLPPTNILYSLPSLFMMLIFSTIFTIIYTMKYNQLIF